MSRIQKLENVYKEKLENKNIKQISDFIQSIVDTDITKGKYTRFLIDCFLNDKFLEEDLIGGLDSTVGQAISLFHKHKSKLPINERSVYALNQETGKALYQSPGDLWNSVKQYQDELSGKELKKEEQEQIYRETEFIYKDEETGFQIISPLTKESAQWWGKGTRWCTSAEKNNQFEYYAKHAPLLILLMPTNARTTGNGKKLQLWKYDNYIQFMNEADNIVSLEYIKLNWNILEPVCLWLNDLLYIPEKYITKKICELAVKQNGMALEYVPNTFVKKYKNYNICELAVKQNGNALQFVPNPFWKRYKDYNMCLEAVKQNKNALEFVPDGLKKYNLYLESVQQNGYILQYIPEEYKTSELCKIAVKQNGYALQYVPKELRTKELCKIAVQQNGYAIQYVPDGLKDYNLYLGIIKQNGNTLYYVPKEYKDYNICMEAVQQNGSALYYVPKELKTKELCELAIKQDGWILQSLPKELRTKELCELVVKQNGLNLQYVPECLKTTELCELAVQQEGSALHYVPDELKTKELCKIAVQQNKLYLMLVPEQLQDELQHYVKDKILELPMDKYQKIFQEIKTFFLQKDISLDYHS